MLGERDDVVLNLLGLRLYLGIVSSGSLLLLSPPTSHVSLRHVLSSPQIPMAINTSSFANSSGYRRYIDNVLKEELGHVHVGVPGFFNAFFRDGSGLD